MAELARAAVLFRDGLRVAAGRDLRYAHTFPPIRPSPHVLLSFAFGFFLLAAILSSGLYGVYVDHERSAQACHATNAFASLNPQMSAGRCTEWLDFQTNLYKFSIVVAWIVGSFGTTTEWVRTRRQR
jgi:hypothetical protein